MILEGVGIVKVERLEFHYMQYFYIAITISLVITKWREGHTPCLLQFSMSTYSVHIITLTYSFVCLLSQSDMERDCTIAHSLSLLGVWVCALQMKIERDFFSYQKERESWLNMPKGEQWIIEMLWYWRKNCDDVQRNLKLLVQLAFKSIIERVTRYLWQY